MFEIVRDSFWHTVWPLPGLLLDGVQRKKTAKLGGGAWPGKEFALALSAFSPPDLSAIVFRRVPTI